MTLIWLRVALICYAAGLLYALVALTRTSEILSKVALHAAYLGMVFHFVSLVEAVVEAGQLTLASVHNSADIRRGHRPAAVGVDFGGSEAGLARGAYPDDLYRIRSSVPEFRGQLVVSATGASAEVEKLNRNVCAAAGAPGD
jgi:hypothetical protein